LSGVSRGREAISVVPVVCQPGLQVAWAAEIEKILSELLEARQRQGGEAILAGLIQTPETSHQEADS
jgi:hypothetical protein